MKTWDRILATLPDQKRRIEFVQYIRTGQGTSEFLELLESPKWTKVVDSATDLLTEAVHGEKTE